MWTEEARDELLAEVDGNDTFTAEERALIAESIRRYPLDTLVTQPPGEEPDEIAAMSDAARILTLADLTYGPGRWIDSYEMEQAMGEWFDKDNPPNKGL
jgi:hypothetical protein